MVIVRIFYGLGNQMFQYAAARRLAHVLQTDLKLDITCFEHWRVHPYGLHAWNIRETLASAEEAAPFNSIAIRSGMAKRWFRLRQMLTLRDWTILYENEIRPVDRRVLDATGSVYLGGYWLSEAYFSDIADVLRREFTLREEPCAESLDAAERIRACDAVGVHVRRGQLAVPALQNQTHGPCCSLDYYEAAAKRMGDGIRHPRFFVFSDEPEWVVRNLRLDWPVEVISHNDASRCHEDLWLMSLCRHQIIANSSFSWWAAWLNANPGKMVIAPRIWLHGDDQNVTGLVPSDWFRI